MASEVKYLIFRLRSVNFPVRGKRAESERKPMLTLQAERALLLSSTLLLIGFAGAIRALHTPVPVAADQKTMSSGQRAEVEDWVHHISEALQADYYDRTFHGIDLKARTLEAEDRVKKAATLSDAMGVIAWMLEGLNDSHTFFLPPPRPYEIEHGWSLGMVGASCCVMAVKPGSDAEAQDIHPGDEVISLEGFPVNRDDLWKLQYAFLALSPRAGMTLEVRPPGASVRSVLVKAKVQKLNEQQDVFGPANWFRNEDLRRMSEPRAAEPSQALMIWKLPGFNVAEKEIDQYVARAEKHGALILDLRGNPGGSEDLLAHLIASVFKDSVNVGTRVERKSSKPWLVKPLATGRQFKGELVVLIDGQSASAAEIFARVAQIEKRGTVIGDRSSGSVMEARHQFFRGGTFEAFGYGLSMTVADLIMTDGKSLEHSGVIPDKTVLPSAEDLAAGRDPAMAQAAADLGVTMTPEQAGKLFPTRWREN